MTAKLTLYVDGIAFWAPTLPGWDAARSAFRGEAGPLAEPAKRPQPQALAPAERRRAPDTVALALEVAARAVEQSGIVASELPAVFASTHGDLAINDYMCATLAGGPTLLSPIKFHNSVHNAAAGYWTIGTACRQSSVALTAYRSSFAAGLLEAATLCVADQVPVLLVGYDIEAVGPLKSVVSSSGLLAAALVVAPERSARSRHRLDCELVSDQTKPAPLASRAARALAGNDMADALPLFEALANDAENVVANDAQSAVAMPLSASLALQVRIASTTSP